MFVEAGFFSSFHKSTENENSEVKTQVYFLFLSVFKPLTLYPNSYYFFDFIFA